MENGEALLNVLKVFGLAGFSFFAAFASTPLFTHYFYKYGLWPKHSERNALIGGKAVIVGELLQHRANGRNTPRIGGMLVWTTVLAVIVLFAALPALFPGRPLLDKLNFLSRGQTWLPLFALIAAALIGLIDDLLQIGGRGGYVGGGLALTARILLVAGIGLIGALWFYGPLGRDSIMIPFAGDFRLGIIFIPFFIITMIAVFSGGVIDGLDGLAGGVLAPIIGAYAGIAYAQNQIDLAAFLAVVAGALLAFLWYNIPPARFYLGETGMLALTSMLTVVAFLTNAVAVLPIIAFPLVLETASNVIQVTSKKFTGKKVFRAAPIHHHFEAKGWPHFKVTMRMWIISVVTSLVGMVIHIMGMV